MDESAMNNTFWGLILQPGKRYESIVEKSFHVSMAALDIATSDATGPSRTQVMISVDGQEYILCHLSKKNAVQQTLDLNFQGGDSLALYVEGQSPLPVHLTGFYNEMDEDDLEELDMSDMSGEEEEVPDLVPIKASKMKALLGKQSENGNKRKATPVKDSVAKKAKVEEESDDEDEDDDDDDDEGDEEEDDDDSDEGEEVEEGFSDDEAEDGEEEEEDDDEDEDSDDEDEPVIPLKKAQPIAVKREPTTPGSAKKKLKENGMAGGDATPSKVKKEDAKKTPVQAEKKAAVTPKSAKRTIGGGVMVEDLTVGGGAVAKRGRPVSVYYVGKLKQNNKQFDATTAGPGFKFRLGGKEVIKGWDIGVEGMKVGGKRRITCPPHMAYGNRGSPPVIPPNSTLMFDVTLKNVH